MWQDEELILRRIQHKDGRSRAFVNDQPTSVSTLRQIGAHLVELHGQHDDRAMMESATHRSLLDAYGSHQNDLAQMAASHNAYKQARKALQIHEAFLAKQEEERAYNLHALDELSKLAPLEGEEVELAALRLRYMNAQKLNSHLEETHNSLEQSGGAIPQIAAQMRKLERKAEVDDPLLTPIRNRLCRGRMRAGCAANAPCR